MQHGHAAAEHHVERVVNLADLRFFLFEEGAIHPCIVIRYRGSPPLSQAVVEYLCPKADWAARKTGRIELAGADVTALDPQRLLSQLQRGTAPVEWKQHLWATPRDLKLLNLLRTYTTLGDRAVSLKEGRAAGSRRLWIGSGFQPAEKPGAPAHPPLEPGELYVESEGLNLILTEAGCQEARSALLKREKKKRAAGRPLSEVWLRRNPEAGLCQRGGPSLLAECSPFAPPHVLYSKGGGVAFADFRVAFQHTVYGIHGAQQDEDVLRFLTAYLDSPLAEYFWFHVSASRGQERGDLLIDELVRLPFPEPDELLDAGRSRAALREVAEQMREAAAWVRNKQHHPFAEHETADRIRSLRERCHALIADYFGLLEVEKILLHDWKHVIEPSCTPTKDKREVPAHAPAGAEHRERYIHRLLDTLNGFFPHETNRFDCSLRMAAASADLGMVGLTLVPKASPLQPLPPERHDARELEDALSRLGSYLTEASGGFELRRGACVFVQDGACLILPLRRRFFTETAAINDADTLAAALLGASFRGHE